MSHGEQFSRHVRRIAALAGGGQPDLQMAANARIAESWRRSIEQYGIDPEMPSSPRILGAAEVRECSERIEPFLQLARIGTARLHAQIREAGYCVLMTDADGTTVDYHGQPTLEHEFRSRGFRLGACWSERDEGTCGVGTTLVDRVPILVHKDEHFRAYNIGITCSAAPVFGPDNRVMAVINASALAAPDDRRSQSMVFQLVSQNARLIENAYFIEAHRHLWTLQITGAGRGIDPEHTCLLALDERGRVVASNFQASLELLDGHARLPLAFDHLFDPGADELLLRAHDQPGRPVELRQLASGRFLNCIVRTPERRVQQRISRPRSRDFASLMIADSRLRADIHRLRRVVDCRLPILLLGETGSGKEAFAQAIHAQSQRRDKAFVALNCAAIPENLIESELFGYREGAFTGAKSRGETGKVQMASGGTLFLDEIGDMPLQLQTRLLRVLAEGEVLPLGGGAPEKVDLHVICATHRDLEQLVAEGRFREDLFYRLNAATFRLPPLRERTDRREVILHVFGEECAAAGRDIVPEESLVDDLAAYHWPGNIRQLRNALRYAVAVCDADRMTREHLPEAIVSALVAPSRRARTETDLPEDEADERRRMLEALEATGWRATEAAQRAGIPRATFYRRMARYGLGRGRGAAG